MRRARPGRRPERRARERAERVERARRPTEEGRRARARSPRFAGRDERRQELLQVRVGVRDVVRFGMLARVVEVVADAHGAHAEAARAATSVRRRSPTWSAADGGVSRAPRACSKIGPLGLRHSDLRRRRLAPRGARESVRARSWRTTRPGLKPVSQTRARRRPAAASHSSVCREPSSAAISLSSEASANARSSSAARPVRASSSSPSASSAQPAISGEPVARCACQASACFRHAASSAARAAGASSSERPRRATRSTASTRSSCARAGSRSKRSVPQQSNVTARRALGATSRTLTDGV